MARTGHVNKMARRREVPGHASRLLLVTCSHATSDGLTIRSLRDGDTETVSALFARLGERSRERRFCGAKPRLSELELANLARVDRDHHVLVGYLDGDTEPVGNRPPRTRRLGGGGRVRRRRLLPRSRRSGSILASELAADARAAGITQLTATVCGDNPRVLALLQRLGSLDMSWRGGERELVVGL